MSTEKNQDTRWVVDRGSLEVGWCMEERGGNQIKQQRGNLNKISQHTQQDYVGVPL